MAAASGVALKTFHVALIMCMFLNALSPINVVVQAQTINCGQVVNSLSPCVDYLINGGAVSPNCCTGVRRVYGEANTTPNRQAICKCLKSALGSVSYSANNLRNAQALPGRCNIRIPHRIDPSMDCSKIRF